MESITPKVYVTNSPRGVSIPQITKKDVVMFGNVLAKCRRLDLSRRLRQGKDIRTDSDVQIIIAFCTQALEDVKALEKEGTE